MAPPKVFQIGFNKCATRTLAQFFEVNGYPSVHYLGGRLAKNIQSSKSEGVKPLTRWKEKVFFSDMELVEPSGVIEGYREFAYLDLWYPDAQFILNVRNKDDWLLSRLRHEAGDYLLRYMRAYGDTNPITTLQRWSESWDVHLSDVRAYFADNTDRLLEFDIDKDGPQKIVDHFDGVLELDQNNWGYRGKSSRYAGRSGA